MPGSPVRLSGADHLRPVGDRAVLLELDDDRAAHAAAALVRRVGGDGVADVVAGHRTLLVAWHRPPPDPAVLAALAGFEDDEPERPSPRRLSLPVRYDGPDLAHVAALTGLSEEEVIRRHAAARYRVAFVGFAPGFGYLLGGDPRLEVPRREQPRERVPAGSVALAGPYSAVYPSASPGGWQLIGTTQERMFDPRREPPSLVEPGVEVGFAPV